MQLTSRRSLGGPALLLGTEGNENASPARKSNAKPPKSKRYSSAFDLKQANSPKTFEEKKQQQAVAELYQDVVKRVQENKLTAKNAFGSRNIIDNLDVVLQLAKGSFHKASTALSTAAEVYCLEVDDLCATTSLVQEMLFNSDNKRGELDGEDARANRKKGGAGNENGGANSLSMASTLETNLANIRSDQVEAELEVDAQFQKLLQGKDTGAQGMLLNILGVCNGPNLALDCTGIPAFPLFDEESENVSANKLRSVTLDHVNLKAPKVLEFKVGSSLNNLHEELAKRTNQEWSATSQTTSSVVESLDPRTSFGKNAALDNSSSSSTAPRSANATTGSPSASSATGSASSASAPMEDYDYDDYMDAGGDDYDAADYPAHEMNGSGEAINTSSNNHALLSPEKPSALPFIMKAFEAQAMETISGKIDYFEAPDLHESPDALAELAVGSMAAALGGGGKFWLGDIHWKAPRSRDAKKSEAISATKKKKAEVKLINFFAAALDERTIFAKPASARTNQLPKSSLTKSNHILPRNTHFTVTDLCKLFVRPTSLFKPVVLSKVVGGTAGDVNDPYQYYDEADVGGDDGGGGMDDYDDDNDFYDCETAGAGASPLRNLVAPAHHVERIRVAYATRAKKVDVKKLKNDLWETIDLLTSTVVAAHELNDSSNIGKSLQQQEDVAESQVSLVSSIKTLAPKEANDAITVPFYFICMLHLANEHGLELASSQDLDDIAIFKTI